MKISTRTNIALATTGISLSALAFVIGIFVGNFIPSKNFFAQDTVSSWVSAAATVVITILTFILAIETWRLRSAQTAQIEKLQQESIQPNVSLSLTSNAAGVHFMDAVISNSGKGIARNIRFLFLNRDGSAATGDSQPIIKSFKELSMFEHGIESLGIGQQLSSFVFSFLELQQKIGVDVFSPYLNVVITYDDVEGRKYSNAFTVDFIQYKGVSKLSGGPMEKISSEIKEFRKAFEKIIVSSDRIGVNIYDSDDRGLEAAERTAWIDQQQRSTD